MLQEYNPEKQSYFEIAGLFPWDFLFTGNQQTLDSEDRCGKTIERILGHLSATHQHFKITRQSDKGADGMFIIEHGEDTNETSAQNFYTSLEEIINLNSQQSYNVLMDITSLELDTILHLQYFLNQQDNVQNIFALYTSPQEYQGRDEYRLRLNEIAQPPGYISLHLGEKSSYPHIFILGFDTGRALRFFDQFDEWKDNEKYAIIVTPPYVPEGKKKAEDANPWLKELESDHIFSIPRLEPHRLSEKLQTLYQQEKRLDIIPLGPKLMLLGATHFYFSLDEGERNNIRILYDFPQSSVGITSGIDKHYLFDCNDP